MCFAEIIVPHPQDDKYQHGLYLSIVSICIKEHKMIILLASWALGCLGFDWCVECVGLCNHIFINNSLAKLMKIINIGKKNKNLTIKPNLDIKRILIFHFKMIKILLIHQDSFLFAQMTNEIIFSCKPVRSRKPTSVGIKFSAGANSGNLKIAFCNWF